MHRALLLLTMSLGLAANVAAAAEPRKLTIKTSDGRVITGVVVLETDRTLLLRTEQGNVNVAWSEIESSEASGAAPSTQGTPTTSAPSTSKLRLGFAVGLGGGPSGSANTAELVWWALPLSALVDLDLGRFGLRFALDVQPGLRGIRAGYRPSMQLFAGVDSQFRLHFTERFGIGLGLVLGVVTSYQNFSGFTAAFAVGPTLTLAAVRLGPKLEHEVSLGGEALFASGVSNFGLAGGLGVVQYAYLF